MESIRNYKKMEELLQKYMANVVFDKETFESIKYTLAHPMIKSNGLLVLSEQHSITTLGVTDNAIIAAEERLKVKFPPSYKEFLKFSNGLHWLNCPLHLLPIEDVEFLSKLDPNTTELLEGSEFDYFDSEEEYEYAYKTFSCYGFEVEDCCIVPGLLSKDVYSLIQISIDDYYTIIMNPNRLNGEEWEVYNMTWEPQEMYAFPSFRKFLEFEIDVLINS